MDYKKLLKGITVEEAERAISEIHIIQRYNEKYKNSYFWSPGSYADSRRKREFEYETEFTLNGNVFNFSCSYQESCKHCYYNKSIYFNDEQITMRTINILEKKLKEFIGK